jgi:DNA-binding transcriptional LysR family regulator
MDRLEAMSLIVAVTETGSISAASRRLKSPVATVSRKVAELEARLKAQLFQRTSRRMTLTDAGRSYTDACRRIIEQVDDAEREVSGEYRLPKGEMAVTAPWVSDTRICCPWPSNFSKLTRIFPCGSC